MNKNIGDRIQERLRVLGMSAAEASRRSGMNKDFIRDIVRRPVKPGAESLDRLAQTLKTSTDYLLHGEDDDPKIEVEGMPVVGTIEAGQYRDITLADQDEEYPRINVVRDRRYPHAKQYALRVSGDSMNEIFPDGSYVICVNFPDTGLVPRNGMIVHVERSIAGTHLIETTLKQVQDRNGKRYLIPRSTNRNHKPIEVNGDDDLTKTMVKGLVIGSYTPVEY